jgi:hypothetical protein
MKTNNVLRKASDVRYRLVEDEGILVRQRTAEVLVVNEVGVRFLDLMDGSTELSGLVDRLVEEFEVDRTELEKDLLSFAGELVEAGVVEVVA